jgi:hypothetical protein
VNVSGDWVKSLDERAERGPSTEEAEGSEKRRAAEIRRHSTSRSGVGVISFIRIPDAFRCQPQGLISSHCLELRGEVQRLLKRRVAHTERVRDFRFLEKSKPNIHVNGEK